MSSVALAWAMRTDLVDDPLDRLILMYLGDNAGGGADDFDSRYDENDELLRLWTRLDTNDIIVRLERLHARGVVAITDPDSLHSLAPSCDVIVGPAR